MIINNQVWQQISFFCYPLVTDAFWLKCWIFRVHYKKKTKGVLQKKKTSLTTLLLLQINNHAPYFPQDYFRLEGTRIHKFSKKIEYFLVHILYLWKFCIYVYIKIYKMCPIQNTLLWCIGCKENVFSRENL